MKIISMSELKVNDLFCFEVSLKKRTAYLVNEIMPGKLKVTDRNTQKEEILPIKNHCIYLKSIS